MFTNCVLVGKVKEKPVVETSSKGNVYAHVLIECERSYPNPDGMYQSDLFRVTLWRGIAEEVAHACEEGSIIAVKGRLEAHSYVKDDRTFYVPDIIAERVRLIS